MSYRCPDPTVLQADLETLRKQWAEENNKLLNNVSVEIQNSINMFNRDVDNLTSPRVISIAPALSFPSDNPSTGKPWHDVSNFSYGGPDDRGYFGSSGDLGNALEYRIAALEALAPIEPEAQELLNRLKPQENISSFKPLVK